MYNYASQNPVRYVDPDGSYIIQSDVQEHNKDNDGIGYRGHRVVLGAAETSGGGYTTIKNSDGSDRKFIHGVYVYIGSENARTGELVGVGKPGTQKVDINDYQRDPKTGKALNNEVDPEKTRASSFTPGIPYKAKSVTQDKTTHFPNGEDLHKTLAKKDDYIKTIENDLADLENDIKHYGDPNKHSTSLKQGLQHHRKNYSPEKLIMARDSLLRLKQMTLEEKEKLK